jgi:opacity protein-like surface antigen
MKRLVVALVALPALAAAQPGNYYAQPPPPQPVPSAPEVQPEPKAHLELAILASSPRGDWKKQLGGETSPGLQLRLGFAVAPNISVFGGVRYVRVNYDEAVLGSSDLRLSQRELQLGMRFTTPVSPTARLFVEGDVHSATLTASVEGDSESESGVGLGVRAGVMFMLDRKIGLGFAIGYSSADIELNDGEDEFEDEWLSGDVGLTFLF